MNIYDIDWNMLRIEFTDDLEEKFVPTPLWFLYLSPEIQLWWDSQWPE